MKDTIMRNLVDDWRRAHYWLSLRFLIPAGAIDGAAMWVRSSHPFCQQSLPHDLHLVAWTLLWGALLGRFVKQQKDEPRRPTVPKDKLP